MATRTLSGFFGDALHRRTPAEPIHPLVHQRRVTALVLTVFTVALAIVLVVTLGPEVLAAYLPMLPMAFVLLWFSTSALRFDEREPREA